MSAPYGAPPPPGNPGNYPPGFGRPPAQGFVPQPMMAGGWPAPGVWTCPFCRYQGTPDVQRQVSSAGWIVFALLLIFTCILFCWIGLLIKEDVRFCPSCRSRVG